VVPENYLGAARGEGFASPDGAVLDTPHGYVAPPRLALNHWALADSWTVGRQAIMANQAGGRILYRFHARDLHLVMAPPTPETPARFQVLVDSQPPGPAHGTDIDEQGNGTSPIYGYTSFSASPARSPTAPWSSASSIPASRPTPSPSASPAMPASPGTHQRDWDRERRVARVPGAATGRRRAAPGQYLVQDLPVLSAGPTPASTCRIGSSPSPTRPASGSAGTGTASAPCPANRSPPTCTASPAGPSSVGFPRRRRRAGGRE
jgi:Thioredoxin like C-terminal domain